MLLLRGCRELETRVRHWLVRAWARSPFAVIFTDYPLRPIFKAMHFAIHMNYRTLAETVKFD